MTRGALLLLAVTATITAALAWRALAEAPAPAVSPSAAAPSAEEGQRAFLDVAGVLQSPRCANCHPADGHTPLVGDDGRAHPQDVTRDIEKLGMTCQSCHRSIPSALTRAVGAPPAVPGWSLPPKDHPMPFAGRSPRALCLQLRDPKENGGKDGPALLHHVTHDPLVLYGWDPGGKRTTPRVMHTTFVARFAAWVESGMACPPDDAASRASATPR